MNSEELRKLQAPLKETYKQDPSKAVHVLHAEAELSSEDIACTVATEAGEVEAGLHPATGGDGSWACSGDMLLQALVACAGVTLQSVATAMGIPLKGGSVKAHGTLDFKGTLGVDREAPVGFKRIELLFELEAEADNATLEKLIELTERYCVVYQTLQQSPDVSTSFSMS